jgi:hypothetical protein
MAATALPVLQPAHTRYRKSVLPVPSTPATSGLFVLKDGHTNVKLGRDVTKGRYRGMRLFSLTLEERATCWEGCQNWTRCYGDNMPFACRYEPGPALERALAADVDRLAHGKRTRTGFVVRLHVLGDFYSVDYVARWAELLDQYSALHLFGYTHWRHTHPIGAAVAQLAQRFPERAAFRRSDQTLDDVTAGDPLPTATTISVHQAIPNRLVLCPEQRALTPSCAACGLCMNTQTPIAFADHSRAARSLR